MTIIKAEDLQSLPAGVTTFMKLHQFGVAAVESASLSSLSAQARAFFSDLFLSAISKPSLLCCASVASMFR